MTTHLDRDSQLFGDLLRQCRVGAGLTQAELAERAGLSVRGISDLERGARARPHRDTLLRLADALAVQGPARAAFVGAARQAPNSMAGVARITAMTPAPSLARLPSASSALFGRDAELVQLDELLRAADARLVTLTGPGGTGKTRLALAAAARAADAFADGVVVVDLSPLTEAELVVSHVAASLDIRQIASESLRATLARRLAGKQLLLLIDNCEQVVGAAADLASLLATCSRVTMLATSREPLRLRVEQVFPVSPLALPDPDRLSAPDLTAVPAVALFVERARACDPSFLVTEENAAAIATICARLDGLPLAIELAAARITVLPLAALRDRLERGLSLLAGGPRDAPARQRTLRDTIAWSYDLLTPEEQMLFRRLGVFTGGWTLEIADAIVGFDSDLDVLIGLASLVDKSLVRLVNRDAGHARYGMLDTIREYAAERLAADPDADRVRRAHLDAMLQLAQENGLDDLGPSFESRLARLTAEEPNLRSALEWALRADPEAALRLTARLRGYWWFRSRFVEGLALHERVLATGAGPKTPERAIVLYRAAWYAQNTGDYARADTLAEAALTLAERLGEAKSAAHARFCQGSLAGNRGEWHRAVPLLEDALARFESLGEVWGAKCCLTDLGIVALDRGDAAAAASFFERCLAESLEHHAAKTMRAVDLGNLALAYRYLGHLDAALELSNEALALAEVAGSAYEISGAYSMLSMLALDRGETGRAATLSREDLALRPEIGDPWSLVQSLENAAAIMAAGRRMGDATRVIGASFALRTAIGSPLNGYAQTEVEGVLASLRAALSEPAFARAWAEGGRLSSDDAVALALSALAEVAAES